MLAELLRYLEYPFVRYAIVAAMLISLCSALVGVILVLKRYSYIGDGLSHVAFGAMSIALVLGMIQQKMYLVFPITTVAAILILKSGQNKRVQGDAIVGMVSTGALALGYLLMNLFPPTANISEMYVVHFLDPHQSLHSPKQRFGYVSSHQLSF